MTFEVLGEVPLGALDRLIFGSARCLSDQQVWRMFGKWTRDLSIALCLHHVSSYRRNWLTISPAELDLFIERALGSGDFARDHRLTISFDDGYEDACAYVASRARRYPEVEWVVFVCPEKTRLRVGFRCDLELERGRCDNLTPCSVDGENQRADLRWVAELDRHALATVEQCRALQRFSNVRLGNHTNCHFRSSGVPLDDFARDYRQSAADFEGLFGRAADFAFPYGGPNVDFDERHVAVVNEAAPCRVWSTARRPYRRDEREGGAVLPRFSARGQWSAEQIALWIAALSARARRVEQPGKVGRQGTPG